MSYVRALLSVLSDLTQVLLGSGTRTSLPAPTRLALTAPRPLSSEAAAPSPEPLVFPLSTHTTAYCGDARVLLYKQPARALDTVLRELPYATAVVAERHEGQFTQVVVAGVRGWVHKDALIYDEARIFPVLVRGTSYDAHHEATEAIRRYLHDPFAAAALMLPLLPAEYVTYELARRNYQIRWPEVRPRPAGMWHELLHEAPGILTGSRPRTGSLMEWLHDDGEGALRYVEAVHPDQSIVVAGVVDADGRYEVLELTEAQWQSLRPVFITVA